MKTKSADYQELERISNTAPEHKFSKHNLSLWLVNTCKFLVKALIRTDKPQIWQKTNRQGEIYWKVYDPLISRTAYFSSEAEVRIWLEQRYYSRAS